jgi:hypothetical protein
MLRNWTEMLDAGIPMPAASVSMPMPSYAGSWYQCGFKILKLVGADVERTMGHNNVAMSGQVLLVNL